jgi:hypothetical protein
LAASPRPVASTRRNSCSQQRSTCWCAFCVAGGRHRHVAADVRLLRNERGSAGRASSSDRGRPPGFGSTSLARWRLRDARVNTSSSATQPAGEVIGADSIIEIAGVARPRARRGDDHVDCVASLSMGVRPTAWPCCARCPRRMRSRVRCQRSSRRRVVRCSAHHGAVSAACAEHPGSARTHARPSPPRRPHRLYR